jgi:hypothetical protein
MDSNIGAITKFDVISFAKSILSEVGKVRAFADTTDDITQEGFTLSKESKINAFFRLIGLPMFVTVKKKDKESTTSDLKEGNNHITPGYSQSFSRKLSEYVIDNSKDVKTDLEKREVVLLKKERDSGTNEMNEAMTNAISLPIPLLANVWQEIGGSSKQTAGGEINYKRDVFKKLKPLMTTYINGGVKPCKNELARPFLRDPEEQLVDSETMLPKPFIETVIRTRLVSCSGGGSAQQQENKQNFLDSLQQYLGDENLSSIFTGNWKLFTNSDLLERFIVYRLVDSLTQLAAQWVELQKIQERLHTETTFKVVIKTTSSKQSPFGKRTEITADALMAEESDLGKRLRDLRQKQIKQEALLSLLPTEDVVTDDKNSKIKNTKNVALATLVTPFVTLISSSLIQIQKQISDINDEIIKKGREVEGLRLQTEMMTGEFTGLSIVDVVIVIMALFMIDKKDLINLLDSDSVEEMKKDPILETALYDLGIDSPSTQDAKTAVSNLEKMVDQLYILLNIEIAKIKDRPSRNEKIYPKRTK